MPRPLPVTTSRDLSIDVRAALSRRPFRSRIANNVAATCFVLALWAGRILSAEPEREPALTYGPATSTGNASCLAVACHGGHVVVRGSSTHDPLLSRAGRIWLQQDPHARAAETIDSHRYQQILNRLVGPATASGDPRRVDFAARCAACHDPQGLDQAGLNESSTLKGSRKPDDNESLRQAHGIGCESCHGNAKKWLTRHYERANTSEDLVALGLLDLKQPFIRATVCAGCHIGDERHDLNHDMLAAGHPPLRFEFSSDHARLPKHWRIEQGRGAARDQEIQLWTAGQLGSAASALQLLVDRAARARDSGAARSTRPVELKQTPRGVHTATPAPWPELSEYNCMACHQRVRTKAEQTASALVVGSVDGGVPWSSWNYRLALPVAAQLNPGGESLEPRWRRLALLMARPSMDDVQLATIAREAKALHLELSTIGHRLPHLGRPRFRDSAAPALPASNPVRLNVVDVLDLTQDVVGPTADWETLCQATLGLEAVRRALLPDDNFSPAASQNWREADRTLRQIRESLAFGERDAGAKREPWDWPRIALPDHGASDSEGSLRDWSALVEALDRPRKLLRAIDAIQ